MRNIWLGIKIPDEILDKVFNISKKLNIENFKRYERYWLHMTYYFLGKNVKKADIDKISEFIKSLDFTDCILSTSHIEDLNGTIILRFKDNSILDSKHRLLREFIEPLGYKTKDLIPHITLGRLTVKKRRLGNYNLNIDKHVSEHFSFKVENIEFQGEISNTQAHQV